MTSLSASGTRITVVKKRCAWYLRVNLKLHSEFPYAEGEKILEVMLLDRGAGVGGSSSSSGPAVLEDVEESALVKNLVAPSAPPAADWEDHTASGNAVFRTWCRECCNGRCRMHPHHAGGRATAIPAIALDYVFTGTKPDDQLQETAGAPIWAGKCDRWTGAVVVCARGSRQVGQ